MTRPFVLRPYTPADLDACVAIWRTASEAAHPFLGRDHLDADEALVRDVYFPQAEITVASEGTIPVGFIALIGRFVGGLFVSPDRHRRGIGRMLIDAAAQTHGPLAVEVYEENAAARRFYAALGFEDAGRRAVDDRDRPHPLVRMDQPNAA